MSLLLVLNFRIFILNQSRKTHTSRDTCATHVHLLFPIDTINLQASDLLKQYTAVFCPQGRQRSTGVGLATAVSTTSTGSRYSEGLGFRVYSLS